MVPFIFFLFLQWFAFFAPMSYREVRHIYVIFRPMMQHMPLRAALSQYRESFVFLPARNLKTLYGLWYCLSLRLCIPSIYKFSLSCQVSLACGDVLLYRAFSRSSTSSSNELCFRRVEHNAITRPLLASSSSDAFVRAIASFSSIEGRAGIFVGGPTPFW